MTATLTDCSGYWVIHGSKTSCLPSRGLGPETVDPPHKQEKAELVYHRHS